MPDPEPIPSPGFPERFAEAIRVLQRRTGMKKKEIADVLHIGGSALSDLLAGRARKPSRRTLSRLSSEFGVNPAWLLRSEGAPFLEPGASEGGAPGSMPEWRARQVLDEYVFLPLYDVGASAGGGRVVEQEPLATMLAFRRDWIQGELRRSLDDLFLIQVEGDSMVPTLWPGEVILVDKTATRVGADGIYVLRLGDTLHVKRLQSLPGGTVRVLSDNPGYAPFELPAAEEGTAQVLGQVLWGGRRF